MVITVGDWGWRMDHVIKGPGYKGKGGRWGRDGIERRAVDIVNSDVE
jgi:hypothetical protein